MSTTNSFYQSIQNTNLNQSDFNVNELNVTRNKYPQDFFRMIFVFIWNHWDDILLVLLTLSIVMIYISIYGIDLNLNNSQVVKKKVYKIIYNGKANKVKAKKKTKFNIPIDNINENIAPDTSEFQYE